MFYLLSIHRKCKCKLHVHEASHVLVTSMPRVTCRRDIPPHIVTLRKVASLLIAKAWETLYNNFIFSETVFRSV